MHTRVSDPGPPDAPRRPRPQPANLTRQPGNFPGAQLVTPARPALRLRVLSQAALPSGCQRPVRSGPVRSDPIRGQVSSARPGRAQGAPLGLLRSCGSAGGSRRARCGRQLWRRRCRRLAPPRGPLHRRRARGGRGETEGGEEEREGGRGQPGLWSGRAGSQPP